VVGNNQTFNFDRDRNVKINMAAKIYILLVKLQLIL